MFDALGGDDDAEAPKPLPRVDDNNDVNCIVFSRTGLLFALLPLNAVLEPGTPVESAEN